MPLVESFQRDGHVVVPALASREQVDSFRPVIASVVDDVAQRHETQRRIDDYSKLFTQVTNVWRLSEAARRIELHVGRDLQFIRINGTIVGGIVGVVIHAASLVL